MRAALLLLLACGAPKAPSAPPPVAPEVLVKKHDLKDLEHPERHKFLSIDWSTVKLETSADALAVWARIAPTGLDWEDKLEELPEAVERPLAFALIESGNFRCMPTVAKQDCAAQPFDVKEPAQTAGLTDPCLRRLIAIWALDKLDPADLPKLRDPLRAIVSIPPPESELVATVLVAIPENDHAMRIDLLDHAWRAGQQDVVNGAVGKLDEAHLIEAVTKFHIDGALEVLSAEGHRATYLAAVADEQLGGRARTRAMFDLVATDDKLAADVKAMLLKAAVSKDCTVAATAARLLEQFGDKRFVPARPRASTSTKLMRSLCMLASYEQQQRADEASLLAGYVPKKGLERMTVTYDPLGETDDDGDGDPHTAHQVDLVAKDQLVLPEIDDLVKAFQHCAGTVCKSDDREFRFSFKPIGGQLLLTRLEMADRPPCPKP
ncbi:MAG: hypothetical protein H0T65_13385 [Deltaproteobacteria bacterium]|nr:hypothetical protein [Deltaproteobacteria bacterium]